MTASMQEFTAEKFFKPGDLVQGRYRIQKVLHAGPLAIVYHVFDEMIDEDIVLKLLNPTFFPTEADRRKIREVLEQFSSFEHPGICGVQDINEDYDPPFLTLKYYDGLSLRKLLDMRAEGKMPFGIDEIDPILDPLGQVLESVHPELTHGKLSPENILIMPDQLVVTDFGTLQFLSREHYAELGMVFPNLLACLAPESRQWVETGKGQPGAAADIYSVGLIAFEMLTGHRYAPGGKKASELNGKLPKEIDRVFARVLHENPTQRHPTVKALMKGLRDPASENAPATKVPVAPPPPAPPPPSSKAEPRREAPPPPPPPPPPPVPASHETASSHAGETSQVAPVPRAAVKSGGGKGVFIGIGAAVLVAGGIAAVLLSGGKEEKKPTPTPKPAPAAMDNSVEEARKKAEIEAKAKAEEEARKQIEAEARAKAEEEARKKAESDTKAKAEEEARKKAEEEERKKAEEEARKCPAGMVVIEAGSFVMGSAADDSMRNFDEKPHVSTKTGRYCIDQYEYPGKAGQTPKVRVPLAEARQLCEKEGKRLCSEAEWERACKGPGNLRYPYGNDWDAGACNTENAGGADRTLAGSGTIGRCRSGYGVVDMSGNAAEWVADPHSGGDVQVRGGSFSSPDWQSRCAVRQNYGAGGPEKDVGFRCCMDRPVPPPASKP